MYLKIYAVSDRKSNYNYTTLHDNPELKYPYYNVFKANQDKFQFNNVEKINTTYNGDGTLPEISLKYPLNWAQQQKEPVYYKFYDRAEHLSILEMNESVSDIIDVICDD